MAQVNVGIGAGSAEEEGAQEAHNERVAGAAGPNRDQGKIIRMDNDLPITKGREPGKEKRLRQQGAPKN